MSKIEIKFSIIIPNYNYGNYIDICLDSIFELNNPNPSTILQDSNFSYEIIVIDDNSSDNSIALLKSYQRKHPELSYQKNTINKGPAYCRNLGIKKATGNYILFLDADDCLTEGSLEKLADYIQDNNYPEIIISDYNNITYQDKAKPDGLKSKPEGYKITKYTSNKDFFSSNHSAQSFLINYLFNKKLSISAGAIIFHKTVFENIKFCEDLRLNEDLPVFTYAITNYQPKYLNFATVNINKHSNSLRNQFELLNEQKNVQYLTNSIFDPNKIDASLLKFKSLYLSQRYLSLFRSYYIAKQYKLAKDNYYKAIKNNIMSLFRFKYFIKYLKTVLINRFSRSS